MKQSIFIAVFACLLPMGLRAQLTVWPGDANGNGIVSNIDVLYIGLAYGNSGPSRQTTSSNWSPQILNFAWQGIFNNNVNFGHADCDGSGIVDSVDSDIIDSNYARITTFSGGVDSSSMVSSATAALAVDISVDSVYIINSTSILADIVVGDSSNVIDSLYGLAFSLSYDPNLVDTIEFNLDGGWLAHVGGGDSTLISRSWVRDSSGLIDIAITRTDHLNSTGFGRIGSISIVMDDNIRIAGTYTLPIDVVSVYAISASEALVPLRPEGDVLEIITIPTSAPNLLEGQVKVYPNPAYNSLTIAADNLPIESISLYNSAGKTIRRVPAQTIAQHRLTLEDLPPGIYFLELVTADALLRKKIVVMPH